MSTQKTLLTAEEFYLFCCQNDGRYELVDGEVVEMAPANEQHGAVALNIGGAFLSYSRRYGVGRASVETGYVLRRAPDMVRGPDVAFVVAGKDEWESLSDRFSSDAPDIAVEVVSPSNTAAQVERKAEEYLAAGSPNGCGSPTRPPAAWRSTGPTAPPSPTPATTQLPTKSCFPDSRCR